MKKIIAFVLCAAALSALWIAGAKSATEYIVTNRSGAMLYSAASKDSAVLTSAKYNTVLTGIDSSGEFIKTSYDGYTGWIFSGDASLYGVTLTVREIIISSLPKKTVYYEDDEFVSDGLVVKAVYNDGTVAPAKGYTLSVPDMYSVGDKVVTVSYMGKTAEFVIRVNRLPISEIKVTTPPDSFDIVEDTDNPSLKGMLITVYYSDGREPAVTDKYTISGIDTKKLGKQTAVITYKYPDITANIDVNIIKKSVTGVNIEKLPAKTVYYDDDLNINLTGLVFKASYDNGKSEQAVPDSAVFASSPAAGVSNKIILSYAGFSAEYPVTVEKTEIVGISVDPPLKTTYYPGETPDLGGLIVYIEYNSGNRKGTDDYEVDSFSTDSYGAKTVNVYFKKYSASFTVNVISTFSKGDINRDGKVNSSDARFSLRYSAKLDKPDDEQTWLADVNSDGKMTTIDARMILRHTAKLELIK